MAEEHPRAALDRLISANGDDYVTLSRMLGRNAAYVQQYIKRGSPKRLPERERSVLARYFGVDERVLGKADDSRGRGLRLVPKLAVGASAGGGALTDAEALAGKVGFDETWLRQMGLDPARLSLIRVNGHSMQPTLNDGDDIMVDSGTGASVAKSGVYVLRFDGALMVKRLLPHLGGRLSILSDNPDYPPIDNVPASDVAIIGRVVWVGRKL